jgi:hypothetical protein
MKLFCNAQRSDKFQFLLIITVLKHVCTYFQSIAWGNILMLKGKKYLEPLIMKHSTKTKIFPYSAVTVVLLKTYNFTAYS